MKYPKLEKDAVAFKTSSYVDENDDGASYLIFEYNGRTYMSYSGLKGTLKSRDLDKCIEYITQDENSSSVVDKENNFLMEHYIGTTEMNQPIFYRAMDTKGKNINIPKIIDDIEHNYWK